MTQIVLASNNPGKVREIGQMLVDLDLEVLPQSAFNIDEVEETGLSFVENAILKARYAAAESGLPAIADDSGLEVDALKGAPGIYSARYAGEGASDVQNLQKLNKILVFRNTYSKSRRLFYQQDWKITDGRANL